MLSITTKSPYAIQALTELARAGPGGPVPIAELARRREMTEKFVSGEWGVELAGYEEGRTTDRRKEGERAQAWRD